MCLNADIKIEESSTADSGRDRVSETRQVTLHGQQCAIGGLNTAHNGCNKLVQAAWIPQYCRHCGNS